MSVFQLNVRRMTKYALHGYSFKIRSLITGNNKTKKVVGGSYWIKLEVDEILCQDIHLDMLKQVERPKQLPDSLEMFQVHAVL